MRTSRQSGLGSGRGRLVAVSAVAGLGFVALGGRATHADIIQARFDSVSPGRTVSFSTDSGMHYHNTLAGAFNWTRTGGDYDGAGAEGNVESFCVELSQYINYGSTYNFTTAEPEDAPTPGAGMGEERADLLSELFGRHYDAEFTADEAAAFQVAVWEVTHDTGLDLAAGATRFIDGGAFFDLAQDWLDTLDGSGPRTALLVMSHVGAQDHVFAIPNPASAALFGLAGVCGMAGRRRRSTAA